LPSSGAWYVTDNALNGGTIISILDPILVGGGYISEIPHHPDWPGNRDEITVGYAYDAPSSGVNYFFSCSGTNDPQEIIQDNGVLFVISSNPDITLDAFQNELGMYTGFDPNTVYSGNNYLASYHGGSAQIYCLPL